MITYKRGDSLPVYTALLSTGSGSTSEAINLTGCTVRFFMTPTVGTTPKVNALATVLDAVNGSVLYTWGTTDLDTAGEYSVEWEITYPSGKKLTVPTQGYDTIYVLADIA